MPDFVCLKQYKNFSLMYDDITKVVYLVSRDGVISPYLGNTGKPCIFTKINGFMKNEDGTPEGIINEVRDLQQIKKNNNNRATINYDSSEFELKFNK